MKKYNYSGFTLVELVVVITIIAVLATLGIMSYQGFTQKARDSKRLSDITQISQAVITFNDKGFKPVRLGLLLKEFDTYPTDPSNGFGYQYNVNTKGSSSRSTKVSGKGFVICTNSPLESYTDNNGDVLVDYLDSIELDDRSKFIGGKIQNSVSGGGISSVPLNHTIGYYCDGQTTSFNSLIAGGGNNSYGTEACNAALLNPDLEINELGQACRIIFNADSDSQSLGDSPSAGTPFELVQ